MLPKHIRSAMLGLAAGTPDGCFVEVGVYEGGSALVLSDLVAGRGSQQYLFDTFDDPKSLSLVKHCLPRASVHAGKFPDTLPASMPPIAFCLYDANDVFGADACIRLLWPKVVRGGIMMFCYLYGYEHYLPWSNLLPSHFVPDNIKTIDYCDESGESKRWPYIVKV